MSPQEIGINRGGGGGGGHGGGGGRGFGGGGFRRGGGWGGGRGWGWPWGGPYYAPTQSCAWGLPVALTADLSVVGQRALSQSGTYPAFGYANGVLYRFSISGGVLVAQPCNALGVVGDPMPLPEPTGAPLLDRAKEWADQVISLPGQALRAASREFEREIASVKASGAISDPPPGVQPMGQGIKSVETPDYLKTDVRSLY